MTGFNLTKSQDGTKSIKINYSKMEINNILSDNKDKYITGNCEPSSTSNVTFVENNVTTEYKATKIYIVGNANNTKVNMINGVTANGQLIIRNENVNRDKILFMCFPLYVANSLPKKTHIDHIIQIGTSGTTNTSSSANFDADIFAKEVPNLKYIDYTSNLGNSAKVVTYGAPIYILSARLMALENNLNIFNIQPDEYSIISPPVPGEWMECDYVPIDSEEVETYNLPVTSSLVQDSAAHNSLSTMFMYILFLIFTGLSYTLIPVIYKYILKLVFQFTGTIMRNERISKMGYFDLIMIISFIAIAFVCFILGEQYILYGVILAIVTLLGHLIISSKKSMSTNWPINELEREKS